jgi:formylglycine-generating enzyme required for sulfatase activity
MDHHDVFLSYSHADQDAATKLRVQLEQRDLTVFWDKASIQEGDLWLSRLQQAVEACGSFIVLVGRDGVRRWVGAETQVALNRYFGPHDDAQRLPIFPILVGETEPGSLPAFLKLFQATPWNGADPLPQGLLDQIRERAIVANDALAFEGCPFVGLDAFRPEQANLFFGRQKETLDALACFDMRAGSPTVRWLEINGNSGSGKSSLMNAGLLPLVDQGWLWPRTGFETWQRIGPLMPSERPIAVLAEHLARAFAQEMSDVRQRLENGDERALAEWLRSRKQDRTAFLLAIDQFEELFTFADPTERVGFDRLLAHALDDVECPLFLISTVRTDFLDRFDELLPRLVPVRNRSGKPWTLPLIGEDALREIISGPARLARLDVSEVQETMVLEARDEPGALPLVQNALQWLWERRTDGRLSGRLFTERGGLAGILSEGADGLLASLGKERGRALELLFRMVNLDPEGRRHTRRRLPLAEAIAVAGGDAGGRALIDRLAGTRARDDPKVTRPLRLITVTEEAEDLTTGQHRDGWVNLIHETLIRSNGTDPAGRPKPFWPTLWRYIEQHKDWAARREHLRIQAQDWQHRRGLARMFGLAGWSDLFAFRGLAQPGSVEARYLRWSRRSALVLAVLVAMILAPVIEGLYWAGSRGLPLEVLLERWAQLLFKEPPLPELVEIPAGSFVTGRGARASYAQPVQEVTFAQPFHLSSTDVTFEQWDACVADGGCQGFRPDDQGWGRGTRPVINISWHDAQAYVAWLSRKTGATCRLPSATESEYACRAGTEAAYGLPPPAGSDDIAGEALANCWDCGSEWDARGTSPVRSFPANAWGLYDMHGNVWEWVEDCWHGHPGAAAANGQARLEPDVDDCSARVVRGGSWNDDLDDARCATRYSFYENLRDSYIGFRVVCSSPIATR